MDIIEWYRLNSEKAAGLTVHRKPISYPLKGIRRAEHVERWTRLDKLGEGGFGIVWLEKEEAGKLRAVKEVRKAFSKERGQDYLRELLAMAWFSKDQACFPNFQGWFEDEINISIAMEYFELGDLSRCVSGPLPEAEAKSIAFQIAEALAMLHSKAITHRDVKPGNIFVFQVTPHWWVKLGDFGISKRVQDTDTALYTGFTGDYVAPEINAYVDTGEEEIGTYTNAVDIWALGCLIHWLLVGQVPFKKKGSMSTYCGRNGGTLPIDLAEHGVSNEGLNFVQKCLEVRPKARPTAREALTSAWLREGLVTIPSGSTEARQSNESTRFSVDERRLSIADIKDALESAILGSADPTVVAPKVPVDVDSPSVPAAEPRLHVPMSKPNDTNRMNEAIFLPEIPPFKGLSMQKVAEEASKGTAAWANINRLSKTAHLHATVEDYYSDDQSTPDIAPISNRGTATTLSGGSTLQPSENEKQSGKLKQGFEMSDIVLIPTIIPHPSGQSIINIEAKQKDSPRSSSEAQRGSPVPKAPRRSPLATNQDENKEKAKEKASKIPHSTRQTATVTVTTSPTLNMESATSALLAAAPVYYDSDAGRLHWIVGGGHTEVVKYCLDNGADIETRHRKAPFLYTAARYGREHNVKLLLDRGANIDDGKGEYGGTALHIAAASGHVGIVKTLIERGAQIDARDINGDTPLDHAEYRTSYATASVLYQAGAMSHKDPRNQPSETTSDRRRRRAAQAQEQMSSSPQAQPDYSSKSNNTKSPPDDKKWVLVRDLEKNKMVPPTSHHTHEYQRKKPRKTTADPVSRSRRSRKSPESTHRTKERKPEPNSSSGLSGSRDPFLIPPVSQSKRTEEPASSHRQSPYPSQHTNAPVYVPPQAPTQASNSYGYYPSAQSAQDSMGYYGDPAPSTETYGYYGTSPYAQTNSRPGYYPSAQPSGYGSSQPSGYGSTLPSGHGSTGYGPYYSDPTYNPSNDYSNYQTSSGQGYVNPSTAGILNPDFPPYNPADFGPDLENGGGGGVAPGLGLMNAMMSDYAAYNPGSTGHAGGDAPSLIYYGGDQAPPRSSKREEKVFSARDTPESSRSRSKRSPQSILPAGRRLPATKSPNNSSREPYKTDSRGRDSYGDDPKSKSKWKSMLGLG